MLCLHARRRHSNFKIALVRTFEVKDSGTFSLIIVPGRRLHNYDVLELVTLQLHLRVFETLH